jgi:hypothetical protein
MNSDVIIERLMLRLADQEKADNLGIALGDHVVCAPSDDDAWEWGGSPPAGVVVEHEQRLRIKLDFPATVIFTPDGNAPPETRLYYYASLHGPWKKG